MSFSERLKKITQEKTRQEREAKRIELEQASKARQIRADALGAEMERVKRIKAEYIMPYDKVIRSMLEHMSRITWHGKAGQLVYEDFDSESVLEGIRTNRTYHRDASFLAEWKVGTFRVIGRKPEPIGKIARRSFSPGIDTRTEYFKVIEDIQDKVPMFTVYSAESIQRVPFEFMEDALLDAYKRGPDVYISESDPA